MHRHDSSQQWLPYPPEQSPSDTLAATPEVLLKSLSSQKRLLKQSIGTLRQQMNVQQQERARLQRQKVMKFDGVRVLDHNVKSQDRDAGHWKELARVAAHYDITTLQEVTETGRRILIEMYPRREE